MHIDVGTGDGAFVYRSARARPDTFFIGVDAHREGMAEVSRRAGAKPARGGLGNALFVHAGLEQLPGDLEGLATSLTVLLPWGSLLRAVTAPEPAALARLRALCRGGAAIQVVVGFDAGRDRRALAESGIPPLTLEHVMGRLAEGHRAAGFEVRGRAAEADEVARLPTTWARKLVFGGGARRFFVLEGRASAR